MIKENYFMKKDKNMIKKYHRKYYKIKNNLDFIIYYKNNKRIILNNKIRYKIKKYYLFNNLYKNLYKNYIIKSIKLYLLKYNYNNYDIKMINKISKNQYKLIKDKINLLKIDIHILLSIYHKNYHKIKKEFIKIHKNKFNKRIDKDNLNELIHKYIIDFYNKIYKIDYNKISILKSINDINFKIKNIDIMIENQIILNKKIEK